MANILSAVLRALFYADDDHFRLLGILFNSFESESRFLNAISQLYSQLDLLGAEPIYQASYGIHGLIKFMKISGKIEGNFRHRKFILQDLAAVIVTYYRHIKKTVSKQSDTRLINIYFGILTK